MNAYTLHYHQKMETQITDYLDGKTTQKNMFIFTIRNVISVGLHGAELSYARSCARKALVTWMGKRLKHGDLILDGWTVTVWSRTNPFKYQAVRQ